MRQFERSTWVAAIVLGILTFGLIAVVLLPVNILQENATELHKVRAKSEGLEKVPQGFMVMPFEGHSEHAPTVHDLLRGEKESKERTFILAASDLGGVMIDSGKYREAIGELAAGIESLNKLERERALSKFGSPDSVKIHRADLYAERAFALCQLKEYKKGIADLTVAIRNRPMYDLLYLNRAKAYEFIGKPDLAAADRKKAASLKGVPSS